jgi:hypothetical protein
MACQVAASENDGEGSGHDHQPTGESDETLPAYYWLRLILHFSSTQFYVLNPSCQLTCGFFFDLRPRVIHAPVSAMSNTMLGMIKRPIVAIRPHSDRTLELENMYSIRAAPP